MSTLEEDLLEIREVAHLHRIEARVWLSRNVAQHRKELGLPSRMQEFLKRISEVQKNNFAGMMALSLATNKFNEALRESYRKAARDAVHE